MAKFVKAQEESNMIISALAKVFDNGEFISNEQGTLFVGFRDNHHFRVAFSHDGEINLIGTRNDIDLRILLTQCFLGDDIYPSFQSEEDRTTMKLYYL